MEKCKRLKLKSLRVEYGFTQPQMAKICEVSMSTYCSIENGKSDGKLKFWDTLREKFDLSLEKICEIQKIS